MTTAIPQAGLYLHGVLSSLCQQQGVKLIATGAISGNIDFAAPGDELEPFEPVIKVGKGFEESAIPKVWEHSRLWKEVTSIESNLAAPLGTYLPEKDPRTMEDVSTQGLMWDRIRDRNVYEMIDTIRTAREVNWIATTLAEKYKVPTLDIGKGGELSTISYENSREWPSVEGFQNPINTYGFEYIAKLIKERSRNLTVYEKFDFILVSAILLYEINKEYEEDMREASDDVSNAAAFFSTTDHYNKAAMLYELALTMLPPTASGYVAWADLSAKAAAEWFQSLEADVQYETFLWRLWRGMRLAWEGKDLPLLGKMNDLYTKYLEKHYSYRMPSRVDALLRGAMIAVENLRQNEWDLGDRDSNREAWENLGDRLNRAGEISSAYGKELHRAEALSSASKQSELADVALILSLKARKISSEIGQNGDGMAMVER